MDKEVNPVVKYVKDQKSLANLSSTDLETFEFIEVELDIQFKSAISKLPHPIDFTKITQNGKNVTGYRIGNTYFGIAEDKRDNQIYIGDVSKNEFFKKPIFLHLV